MKYDIIVPALIAFGVSVILSPGKRKFAGIGLIMLGILIFSL